MAFTPEQLPRPGGDLRRLNDRIEDYNASNAANQILRWRNNYYLSQTNPMDGLARGFVSLVGREYLPRAGGPPPAVLGPSDRLNTVQSVSPENADVCKEQLAVFAVSEACAAVLGSGSPKEAKENLLKKVPEFSGKTLETLFRDVGFIGLPGRITVSTAVDFWRRAVVLEVDKNDPRYGMSVEKDWMAIYTNGKAAFDAFSGASPNSDYIWEVAMKVVLATNEHGKFGIDAKLVGAQPWMVECARMDSVIKGVGGPDASAYVKKRSSELPVTCEGFLSSVLHPGTIINEENIDGFVRLATTTTNTNLDTPALFAGAFAGAGIKTLGDYYGGAPASVFESLVEKKFLQAFVINPDIALQALTKDKPPGFLSKLTPAARNSLVSALVKIDLNWMSDAVNLRGQSAMVSERKISGYGYRTGNLSSKNFKISAQRFESLYDVGIAEKQIKKVSAKNLVEIIMDPSTDLLGLGWAIIINLIKASGGFIIKGK